MANVSRHEPLFDRTLGKPTEQAHRLRYRPFVSVTSMSCSCTRHETIPDRLPVITTVAFNNAKTIDHRRRNPCLACKTCTAPKPDGRRGVVGCRPTGTRLHKCG
jgi:hypothetical protein